MNSHLIIFILIVFITSFVYPITGYFQHKKLKINIIKDPSSKIGWYRETIILSWIPIVLIILLIPLSGFTLQNLGFRKIDLNISGFPKGVSVTVSVLYLLYFIYNLYSLIILGLNKKSRTNAAKQIPDDFKIYLPGNPKERKVWDLVAITAGITEETIYRGYLFFGLSLLFPNLPLFIILLISTILFGIGHIYQGVEAIKPTLIGLVFGLFYIVLDSIWPLIVLHILQDSVVRNLLEDDYNTNKNNDLNYQ